MAAPAPDWRSQINRRNSVDFIFKILAESYPQAQGRELREIKKIAEEFEGNTYALAKNTDDYCQRVSSKLEEIQRNYDASNSNPAIGNQTSINSGLRQSTIPNMGQTTNFQNASGLSHDAVYGSTGGGAVTNSFSGERTVANVNAFATRHTQIKPPQQQQVVIPSAPVILKALPNSQQPNLQMTSSFRSAPAMVHPTSQVSHLQNRPVPIPQSSEQQQRLYSSVSNMYQNQHPMHLLQQVHTEAQQQAQLRFTQARNQKYQQQLSNQHLMSQTQAQPSQPQQHLVLQQNSLQREMQQSLQAPVVMDTRAQTGDVGVDSCQEIYQKIKSMKETYLSELQEVDQELRVQLEVLSQTEKLSERLQKYKMFKSVLDELLQMLHIPRDQIHPAMIEKLPQYEKKLLNFIQLQRIRKSKEALMDQQFEQIGAHTDLMPEHQSCPTSPVQNMNLQASKSVMNSGSAGNIQLTSMFPPTHLNIPIEDQNISNTHLFQSPMNTLEPDSSPKQPGSVVLQHEQEHYLMQSQQMKQQQPMQQLHQRQKQQEGLQSHQIQQPNRTNNLNELTMGHQMDDGKELTMKQSSCIESELRAADYSETQCVSFPQQQWEAVTSLLVASPQNNQTSSPQISQSESSHIYQTSMLSSSSPKAEKQNHSSLVPDETNDAPQQTILSPAQSQCLTSGTPGFSVSPLQENFTIADSSEANEPTALPGISNVAEGPMAALIKAVGSISSTSFHSVMSDIASIISMTDGLADSAAAAAADNSRADVGKDLVATTKSSLQARKRHANSMCLNMSTAVSCLKRLKFEASHSLLEEITDIEEKLIDVVVKIIEEGDTSIGSTAELGEGVVVEFSFTSVAFSPDWRTQSASSQMHPILLLRVFVPSNYPESSPKVLDVQPVGQSKEFDDLSANAQSNFITSLQCLPQPISVGEMVRVWLSSARKVATDYARMNGGGSFSSMYGSWERNAAA